MIRIYPLNGLLMQTPEDLRAQLRERLRLSGAEPCDVERLAETLSGRAEGGLVVLEFAERMPEALLLPLTGALVALAARDARWEFSLSTGRQTCHG